MLKMKPLVKIPSHISQYGLELFARPFEDTGGGLSVKACTGQSSVSCRSNTSQISQNNRGADILVGTSLQNTHAHTGNDDMLIKFKILSMHARRCVSSGYPHAILLYCKFKLHTNFDC
jgi:hypothetical protein